MLDEDYQADPVESPEWVDKIVIGEERKLRQAAELAAAAAEKDRESRLDTTMAYVLRGVLSSKHWQAASTKELATVIAHDSKFQLGQKLIFHILTHEKPKWPKVFSVARDPAAQLVSVEVHPALDWAALERYPETRAVCTEFLGMS